MMPKRISIAGLMGFVVVVAVGLVALKQADPTWASALFTFTILAVTVGAFRTIFGPGQSRPFWLGFSLAGWLYLFVVYGDVLRADGVEPPPLLTQYGIVRVQEILRPDTLGPTPTLVTMPTLLPTFAPTSLQKIVISPPPAAPPPTAAMIALPPPAPPAIRGPFVLASTVANTCFQQIGQSLWTLLIAWIGGHFAIRLASRRDVEKAAAGEEVSPSSP